MINNVLVTIVVAACIFVPSLASYQFGKSDQQAKIIAYCKADQAYLDNGLMLQCQVVESKMRDRT